MFGSTAGLRFLHRLSRRFLWILHSRMDRILRCLRFLPGLCILRYTLLHCRINRLPCILYRLRILSGKILPCLSILPGDILSGCILVDSRCLPGGILRGLAVPGHILSLCCRLMRLWNGCVPHCCTGGSVLLCRFRTFPMQTLFIGPVDLLSEGIRCTAGYRELLGIAEIFIVS